MAWTPGRRQANRELEAPFDGVPDHLVGPLWTWLDMFMSDDADLVRAVVIEFRLALPDPTNGSGAHGQATRAIATRCEQDEGFFLDVVEFVLEQRCAEGLYQPNWQMGTYLENTLAAANSAYKVREDRAGLETRTTPEVQRQVQAVAQTATGSAGEHLANAWNEAYSRAPDPVKSYSESIKAVEAALAPVISPNNLRATLGTMIGHLNANPTAYKFAIADGPNSDGIATLLGLMRVLWEGQTSRHGGVNPTRHETAEEAQAAVHLAATLVQYGVSGALSIV